MSYIRSAHVLSGLLQSSSSGNILYVGMSNNLSVLANAAGWLHNDGAGVLAYSTPSYTDVGAAPAFTSAAANLFWATPNGGAGVPSLRAIVAADIPALSYAPASGIALTALATQANNTVLGNISGGAAVPSALTSINLAAITLTNLAALTTPAESWVGPSSTAGVYFNGGNVGIGTTGPKVKTDISVAAASPATSGTTPNGFLGFTPTAGNQRVYMGQMVVSPYSGWIQAQDITDLSYAYPLALNPNGGNVGIGTTTPGRALEVDGSGIKIKAGATGAATLEMVRTGASGSWGLAQGNTDTNDFEICEGANTRIHISTGGNFGIGTTGPGVPLDVVGDIRTTTSLTTGAPTGGTAAAWKLGQVRTGVALVVSTTTGIQLDVGGTLYTIPVLTTNP